MKNTIYYKLTRYFIGLIAITSLLTCLLFIATTGRSMIKDAHRMIRQQAVYIGEQALEVLQRDGSAEAMVAFLTRTRKIYQDATLYLLDSKGEMIPGDPAAAFNGAEIIAKMVKEDDKRGSYVKPGHFSGKTIYLTELKGDETRLYLYFARSSSTREGAMQLVVGLAALAALLVIGIYPLAHSLTRPVKELSQGLDRIARGEFDHRVEISGTNDEFQQLVEVFRRMSLSVNEMVESKKQFLAAISHELRSPLGRMDVSLELLREKYEQKPAERYLDSIALEIAAMTEMVRELSIFAKINLPNYDLDLKPLSPKEIVEAADQRYRSITAQKGLQLQSSVEQKLPAISGDPSQLARLMNNLLDNACAHCSPGGLIAITAAKEKDKIVFAVSNRGDEIAARFHEQIFEPLFRGEFSRSRETGGLGLGLSISRKIVDLHGGTIRYGYENGSSVFRFTIPLATRGHLPTAA